MKSLLLASVALVAACSSAAGDAASTTDSLTENAVTFGTCPPGYQTECAQIDMPLDHQNANSETIKVHIARHPARAGTKSTRQIWLLSGGPGQAGDIWNNAVTRLAQSIPDADIYVLDHRGTGYSHRLTCTQQDVPTSGGGYYLNPKDAPACLDELKAKGDLARLPYFTSRQAAADLAQAIRMTKAPDQKVFVWGGSYGTHLAHRFLQIEPNLADGIVFDGFLTPGKFGFIDYDHGAEEAGELFAKGCAEDAACSAHMTSDPLAKVKTIIDGLRTKPCDGIDGDSARAIATLMLDRWGARSMIMPMLHRLERCSDDDVTVLEKMFVTEGIKAAAAPGGAPPAPVYSSSGVLQYNIALSELWSQTGKTATTAQLAAAADAQTFLPGSSYGASVSDLRAVWPLPADDWSSLPLPVTNSRTQLLFLSSGLDMHTPPAQSAAIKDLYPNASFVVLPGGAHTPSEQSPMTDGQQCGSVIAQAFITTGQADTSCLSQMYPVWYAAPSDDFATAIWGTTDDWGDGSKRTVNMTSAPLEPTTPRMAMGNRR